MPARKESKKVVECTSPNCFHCGDECRQETISFNDKFFCCEGCRLVHEILQENNLSQYYQLNSAPGKKVIGNNGSQYDYLDDEKIRQQLISFSEGSFTTLTFLVPQIHCSSCIWLLENLYRLDKGIKRSTVNFLKREVHLVYNENETSIRKIAELLNKIGYSPQISLADALKKTPARDTHSNYYKLGVSFFCFGNIMLFSFPEYFGLDAVFEPGFKKLFGYLNILLSLPVLLYADTAFFKSAITGLRHRNLNMDFPIALGIVVMYGRSLFEIISGTGAGYMDTFAALIFFMLAGRLFQNKTFDRLSFERDYKSYFPIAVSVIENGKETTKTVSAIRKGDRILIRNEELIPADAILMTGNGNIDYSFVTGESTPVAKTTGDQIYAGGKQVGTAIELEVVHEVSQSRLTQLWNESNYGNSNTEKLRTISDRVSRYFTVTVIFIAIIAGSWYLGSGDIAKACNAFTAVLIITCPCALALSYPFTLGNTIRILGNRGFYLKNAGVIEKLSKVDTIVFDKTGTLTKSGTATIAYEGVQLSASEAESVFSLASQSGHPLSREMCKLFDGIKKSPATSFEEIPGQGISGIIKGTEVKIGTYQYAGKIKNEAPEQTKTSIHIVVGNQYKGQFLITGIYREGLKSVTELLGKTYDMHIISGDNDSERSRLQYYFGNKSSMHFRQSPSDKLNFVKTLQDRKKKGFDDGRWFE